MKKSSKRIFNAIAIALVGVTLVGCDKGSGGGNKITNENSPLVFSTPELDGVFNPFFATSGADMSIVGMTQISMLSSNALGEVAYGADEPVVTLDLEQKATGDALNPRTTYTFVLKNGLKFSDGTPLTLKDVLFNMYIYLDPVYSGSSTMYSTDIVGLKEYRTQTADESEQAGFEQTFLQDARDRREMLLDAFNQIKDELKNESLTDKILSDRLTALAKSNENYKNVAKDYARAKELFRKELETDFTSNVGTYDSYKLSNGQQALHSDVETFLHLCGFIDIDVKKNKIEWAFGEANTKKMTRETAIQRVFDAKIPASLDEVVEYWATAENLLDEFSAEAKKIFFTESGTREFKNITGIVPKREGVTINGKEYAKPTYGVDGSVTTGYEALEITIKGIDPKAIWNFGFTVSPMNYYSTKDLCDKFDYHENFGVEFGDIDFMNNAVKDPAKIGLPVGAGPYKATNKDTNSAKVTSASFFEDNVVYFESNEHYVMGKPFIRKLRYKVIATNYIVTALQKGEIHFGEPSAKPEVKRELNNLAHIGTESVMANGYGYIGINAAFVPDIEVRRAIMYAMDTSLVLNYYPGSASLIHRPMTKASWAYPDGATPSYPYDKTGKKSEDSIKAANYTLNSSGLYAKNGKTIKLRFTVAGETTDHPAYQTMANAARILNDIGCDVTVVNDPSALRKLSSGELEVWAAAWGSTIDPDMYQVYHMDSKATSVNNWGYKKILQNQDRYPIEYNLISRLSEEIDNGRSVLDQNERKNTYAKALNLVMELAVELPTYQRDDLFAFNKNYIDTSSFTPSSELSAYNGLINRIWLLKLNEKK